MTGTEPTFTINRLTRCRMMGRITVKLNERDHLAFKLLSLHLQKKLVLLVKEAMQDYLEKTGAYDLSIQRGNSDESTQ